MTRLIRVLFVGEAVTLAHVARCAALARVLNGSAAAKTNGTPPASGKPNPPSDPAPIATPALST